MIKDFQTQHGKFAFVKIYKSVTDPPVSVSVVLEAAMLKRNKQYDPKQIKQIGFVNSLNQLDWSQVVDKEVSGVHISKPNTPLYIGWDAYFDYMNNRYDNMTPKDSGKTLLRKLKISKGYWLLIKYLQA